MAKPSQLSSRVAVVGLGRFGGSLARELAARGSEVLGVDSDQRKVQRYADELTHTATADSTDEDALRQLGIPEYRHAVVGIGNHLESSILTTAILSDFAISNIWAKATSRQHGEILKRVGAHHVVLPEHDMGERVAHLVTGRMLDFIEFEDDYAIVKTITPREAVGRTLAETGLRTKYGVTIVGIKRAGEGFTYATENTVVDHGDILIVAGQTGDVEKFAART